MIAMTNKNGKSVRLSADFHLDTEKAYYTVYCSGVKFVFPDFAPAARVYKTLSRRIEGEKFTVPCLMNLVSGARALGYNVQGA